ncbi:MAG: hypothetical protein K5739_07905 [Lachnospiraceae bacterium]|nr:hypothetical protein [Lachnospiraceae bacterium]
MNYLDRILEHYAGSFDIEKDFSIGGKTAAAYGHFATVSEKYVLTPKANLWKIEGFEHILFFEADAVDRDTLIQTRELMQNHMAPKLVCKGEKYPPKDHMYSYVTVVYLVQNPPAEELQKEIRSFRYEQDYLFTFRGHVEGHLVVMDLSTGKAYTNKAAKHLKALYEKTYADSN